MRKSTPYDRAIKVYHERLATLRAGGGTDELHLRPAFQELLHHAGKTHALTLVPEQRLSGKRITPDGTLRDAFNLVHGYWEAKDTKDDLDTEIRKKRQAGYPFANILFEDTRTGVLFQGGQEVLRADLTQPEQLRELLRTFLTYNEPQIEAFEDAVREFQGVIPDLAANLQGIIDEERKANKRFATAFETFHELCRRSLDPKITVAAIDEMLIQHLLTERLFRTVFDNTDFVRRNVIAAEIEGVIDALASRKFSRANFLARLDRFYGAIEDAARHIDDFKQKQGFLNTVYERFFQGYSVKDADTHGIVYTPQEIVDFMVASVDEVLQQEFGKSISTPGVKILDPCVGTGNFIVNILNRIEARHLRQKYEEDLFCNEIMLLPYYIAALNIEHAYYERTEEYRPFPGLCFTDTLELAEPRQLGLFAEENTARVKREKAADITVVIGNPPYNVGQQNENDNNKNREYPEIERRIRETYGIASKAQNKNALSDAYVRFFRWASDRLQGRDGIVCFITNNGFFDGIAFDGFRARLAREFTTIYHLDLKGNARTSGQRRRREGGNVFEDKVRVGVGVTILVNKACGGCEAVKHHTVRDYATCSEKLGYVVQLGHSSCVPWEDVVPTLDNVWPTGGARGDVSCFVPLCAKESSVSTSVEPLAVFYDHCRGLETTRDAWAYAWTEDDVATQSKSMIDAYNAEVARWETEGRPTDIDRFVDDDERRIKWCSTLKAYLRRRAKGHFRAEFIRSALYRPFTSRATYVDSMMVHRPGRFRKYFPGSLRNSSPNRLIALTDIGSEKPFMVLAADAVSDLHVVGAGSSSQCFPFYTYNEDGTNRRENITDWALAQYRERYGDAVTKWDIFHYVYAVLHHPAYRERYAENLKRELPRVPFVPAEDFAGYVAAGRRLAELHVGYEDVPEYDGLTWRYTEGVPLSYRVEKMRLSKDRETLVVNPSLTLEGIPAAAFEYRLGNRSALEWVVDQYQVKTDKRSGIVSDPNREDEPEYIVRLVGRVIAVSLETVALVNGLPAWRIVEL